MCLQVVGERENKLGHRGSALLQRGIDAEKAKGRKSQKGVTRSMMEKL